MAKVPNFSIIIPNLNGSLLLENCLTSIVKAISKLSKISFEIILVDNASTDNSIQIFSDLCTDYQNTIILNQKVSY